MCNADISEKYLHPERLEPLTIHVKADYDEGAFKGEPEHHNIREEVEPETPNIKEEEPDSPNIKEEEPDSPNIKEEEPEPLYIKEEEEDELTRFPLTGFLLKGEEDKDEGQSEESRNAAPPSISSSQHITAGDHCGGLQVDSLVVLSSDSHDVMSRSHDDDDDGQEHCKDAKTCHTDNNRWRCCHCFKTFVYKSVLKKHMMIHTGEKPFGCSVCEKRFTRNGHLRAHSKTQQFRF